MRPSCAATPTCRTSALFASPERILLFDLNDFDETLPGPFEYDVKRMAASFTIAARNNGFAKADTRAATLASVRAYREAMAAFAQMGTMDIWYAHLDEDELMASIRSAVAGTATQEKKARKQEKTDRRAKAPKKQEKRAAKREKADRQEEQAAKRAEKRAEKTAAKAHTRDSLQALSKLGELVDGKYRIVSQPPIVVPARDLAATYGLSPDEVDHVIREQFRAYRATLQDDRRHLLERFEIVDMARKVVGVGSVGTRAFIVLLQGRDAQRPAVPAGQGGDGLGAGGTPAQEPVPAARRAGGAGAADDAGRQRHLPRLDQRGWTANRHFYWRQLRDMKGSAWTSRR